MTRRRSGPFPAQARYNEKNPSVALRLPREEYERLRAQADGQGKPMSQFLREALYAHMDAVKTAHQLGYQKGYKEARKVYEITILCKICGKDLTVFQESNVLDMMVTHLGTTGFTHHDCAKGV